MRSLIGSVLCYWKDYQYHSLVCSIMRMLLGVTFLYLITEKLKRGVANKSYLYAYSGTLIWPTSWHYFCILNYTMNKTAAPQRKEVIGLIPFGPTLIGTYFISFVWGSCCFPFCITAVHVVYLTPSNSQYQVRTAESSPWESSATHGSLGMFSTNLRESTCRAFCARFRAPMLSV